MTVSGTIHDFDFIFGSWRVEHRRLKARLAGSDEWEDFDGTCVAQPILAGAGNIDDCVVNLPGGSYRAASIRAFNPPTQSWAIWWLDARYPQSVDVPVIGRFDGGEGVFCAEDTFEGKPIIVRFHWHETRSESPHWDQAFSPDGGQTWELNWSMRFYRLAST